MSPGSSKALKALRIGFACALIGVSLWALLLPPLFPYSTHAVVNTKVVTIRSVSDGRVSDLPPVRSRTLHVGDGVGRVTRDQAKVERELAQRELRKEKLQAQLENLDRTVADRSEKLQQAAREVDLARSAALRTLEQARKSADEKARIYRAELTEKKARQAKVEPLFKDGIVTSSQWSETRQQTLEAERNLAQAEAELAAVDARRAAADHGGSPGGEGVEGAANRILSYERELTELKVQRMDLASELAEASRQLSLEKTYGDEDRSYVLGTPIDGVVWRRQVVEGESLTEGQPVVDVADAHSVFVEAYFRRDFMNSIAIGDHASVYLIADGRFVDGKVVDIQVQERTDKDTNIINTMALDTSMLRVRIEVLEGRLKTENIGQLAKVLTTTGRAGWLERGFIWMSLILRSHK